MWILRSVLSMKLVETFFSQLPRCRGVGIKKVKSHWLKFRAALSIERKLHLNDTSKDVFFQNSLRRKEKKKFAYFFEQSF